MTNIAARSHRQDPLRIAMLVPPWYELPPSGYGGIEQVCSLLVDALVTRGHQVTLFGAGTRTGTHATFARTVNKTQSDRLGQALPELAHVARADRMIDDGDFDVVHDHTNAGLLAAIRRGIPTVATVHGSPVGELGDYLSCIDREVALVSISHAQRRLNSALPWTATVHNGFIDPDPPKTRPGTGPVLWLARFIGDKGPDLAIEACREAGLPLVLAGKCNEEVERQYLEEVVEPMLGPDVELVVNAGRQRIRELLMDARCMILPLRWEEPFGMVLVEASASGTPVVTLNRGSAPEVIAHGKTGFICDDPADLADALRQVDQIDPAACVEYVRTQFSPDLMAERYERVYRHWAATVPPLRQFRRVQATTAT